MADHMRWEYRYNDAGQRIGLMQVPEIENNDDIITTSSHRWFDDIEDRVILRERICKMSNIIPSFEQQIANLEKEALVFTRSNGFQPAIKQGIIYHFYYTDSKQRVTVPEAMNFQNKEWIKVYIRQQMMLLRMQVYNSDIKDALERVSAAHEIAAQFERPVIVQISESLRHRLRKAA